MIMEKKINSIQTQTLDGFNIKQNDPQNAALKQDGEVLVNA